MKKCLLGCGLVVWNPDEHVRWHQPAIMGGQPNRLYPPEPALPTLVGVSKKQADEEMVEFYRILDVRWQYIEDNFESITL